MHLEELKKKARAKTDVKDLFFSDIYLKRDGKLISAFMKMFMGVQNGISKMFKPFFKCIYYRLCVIK